MGTGTKVRELVAAWQRAEAGRKPSPADLCAACPELLPELQRQIDALRAAADEAPAATAAPGANEPAAKPRDALPRRGLVRIEGYQILRELGRGGQAVVYEAVQRSTTRRVAVKVLLAGRFATAQERRRLEREAQVLAAVNHPNVVQVIDRGTTRDGFYYLVMEYVVGRPLNEWMERRHAPAPAAEDAGTDAPPPPLTPPADPAESLRLFLKICHAVNAAHLRGIVHRDLKPGNIYIDDVNEPHVLDFGLARAGLTELADPGDGATPRPITVTGQFLGSLPWASPEQAEGLGSQIDARTDVYSLGVILYQLLTGGRFPYNVAGTMREVMDNILKAQPIPPSRVLAPNPKARHKLRSGVRRLPQINPVLEAIALKALSKRREDRYQSAGELARDIEQYLAGKPTLAAPDGGPRWHARPRVWLAAAGVAVVLVALTWGTSAWMSAHRRTGRVPGDASPAASQLAAPPPAGFESAEPYVQPAGRVTELLPLFDPAQAKAPPQWKMDGGGALTVAAGAVGSVPMPYQVPDEYDYIVEFTRTGGRSYVQQLVPNPRGNGAVTWSMGDYFVFAEIKDGRGTPLPRAQNPTRVEQSLRTGQRYTSVVRVRRDRIEAYVNGRLVRRWPTDFHEFIDPYIKNRIGRPRLHARGEVVFHRVAVVDVTGTGKLDAGGPGTAAATAPSADPYVRPAGRVVEILPALDPLRDGVPNEPVWHLGPAGLVPPVRPAGAWAHYRLPYKVPAEYDFLVEYTCAADAPAALAQDVPNPKSVGFVGWAMAYGWAGFGPLKGVAPHNPGNPTRVPIGPRLSAGARHASIVQVRAGGLAAYVDGQLVARWSGDFADFEARYYRTRQDRLMLTSTGGVTFHRIAVVEVNGEGQLGASPAPATRPATTEPDEPAGE